MPDLAEQLQEARRAAEDQQFEEATSLAREVLKTHPSSLLALRLLGWSQLSLGDEGALDNFQTCAQIDPEDALAQVGQAICYEQRGEQQEAVSRFKQAWELDPNDQRIRREIGRLGGELTDSPLAEGIALLQAGRYDAATTPLRAAAAARPDDVVAPLSLATALWRLGGKQPAYNLASSALSAYPQCVKALLMVVAVETGGGRLLRTRELMARVEQVDPGLLLYGDLAGEFGVQVPKASNTGGRSGGLLGLLGR